MAKEKSTEIVLINSGVAVMYINRERVLPNEEITIASELLESDGIQFAIARGEFTVKDNAELNAEIVEKNTRKKKADPHAGKTQKELEDGGEY